MNRTPQKLITRAEAAGIAGVHVATIDRLRKAGKLWSYRKPGDRAVYVDLTQLDRVMRPSIVPAQRTGAGA